MKDVYLIDNKWGWIKKAFTDLAFTFFSSFLYYHDKDLMDEEQLSIYQKGMAAFGGIAPTYHIELRDKSVMIYEFIDKIVIHEADKLTGERIQQMDIYLKYVGNHFRHLNNPDTLLSLLASLLHPRP